MKQDGLPGDLHGIVGFARPDKQIRLAPEASPKIGDAKFFLEKFVFEDKIESAFTTRLIKGYISWVDIGEPDSREQVHEPAYMGVYDDYFWSLNNQGIRIGEDDAFAFTYSKHEYGQFEGGRDLYTVFDTGSPDIYLSILWFEAFVEQLYGYAGIEYTFSQGYSFSTCEGNFPNLYFMFDTRWLQVPKEDYLAELPTFED